ncbi:7459_t:CDS:2 [Entrophospora sp. SA101]|nr:7459_t:CDS:2 [Entrophospora sp. SA101]
MVELKDLDDGTHNGVDPLTDEEMNDDDGSDETEEGDDVNTSDVDVDDGGSDKTEEGDGIGIVADVDDDPRREKGV